MNLKPNVNICHKNRIFGSVSFFFFFFLGGGGGDYLLIYFGACQIFVEGGCVKKKAAFLSL